MQMQKCRDNNRRGPQRSKALNQKTKGVREKAGWEACGLRLGHITNAHECASVMLRDFWPLTRHDDVITAIHFPRRP
jgi:hypothetical protein